MLIKYLSTRRCFFFTLTVHYKLTAIEYFLLTCVSKISLPDVALKITISQP